MREGTCGVKPDMSVNIAGVELKNPVMTAPVWNIRNLWT